MQAPSGTYGMHHDTYSVVSRSNVLREFNHIYRLYIPTEAVVFRHEKSVYIRHSNVAFTDTQETSSRRFKSYRVQSAILVNSEHANSYQAAGRLHNSPLRMQGLGSTCGMT